MASTSYWWKIFLLVCVGQSSAFARSNPSRRVVSRTPKPYNAPSLSILRGGGSSVAKDPPPTSPKLSDYIRFALPCLGLWVASPLLSLVDTSFVGVSGNKQHSGSQLAALGPATTFFDGATYLFAFLNVATTNLYSSAGTDSDRGESVVRTSSRVALRCGLGIMLFLWLTSKPLLKLYIGQAALETPGLLESATDYVRIRSLSMPTSLLLGVLQAALLGAKDSVTPLIAILYCTVVNVCGDWLLVSKLKWGLQGAAIATTLAQWAATFALIRPAKQKLVKNHNLELWKRSSETTKNAVTGRVFLGFAAPVLTLILGKLAAFGFMTHSAAAAPGQPVPLATHQIILSLLFFCSPFLEVISQTAQTFLPPFLAPVKDHIEAETAKNSQYDVQEDPAAKVWLDSAQKVATNLLGVGFGAATLVASTASLVPAFFGNWITSDSVIQQAVKPLAKYLWLGAFFWAPVAVSEGVLLARLELKFLAGIYLLSTALLPPALLQVKSRGGSVEQVWACFVVFQIVRALCFTARIWGGFAITRLFHGRTRKSVKASSS